MAVCYTKATLRKFSLHSPLSLSVIFELPVHNVHNVVHCTKSSLRSKFRQLKLPLYIDSRSSLFKQYKVSNVSSILSGLQRGICMPLMSIRSCCKSETFRQKRFQILFKTLPVFLTKCRVYAAIDGAVGVTK